MQGPAHHATRKYYDSIKYWETPVTPTNYRQWTDAWAEVTRLTTRPLSRALYAHPRGRLGLLLGPAVLWLLVFYLVALVLLLMTSLWQQDVFTAELVRKWTLLQLRRSCSRARTACGCGSTGARCCWRRS